MFESHPQVSIGLRKQIDYKDQITFFGMLKCIKLIIHSSKKKLYKLLKPLIGDKKNISQLITQ